LEEYNVDKKVVHNVNKQNIYLKKLLVKYKQELINEKDNLSLLTNRSTSRNIEIEKELATIKENNLHDNTEQVEMQSALTEAIEKSYDKVKFLENLLIERNKDNEYLENKIKDLININNKLNNEIINNNNKHKEKICNIKEKI
jgi:hypothetical protein